VSDKARSRRRFIFLRKVVYRIHKGDATGRRISVEVSFFDMFGGGCLLSEGGAAGRADELFQRVAVEMV